MTVNIPDKVARAVYVSASICPSTPPFQSSSYDTKVTLSCPQGFAYSNGLDIQTSVCTSDGVWSPLPYSTCYGTTHLNVFFNEIIHNHLYTNISAKILYVNNVH